VGGRTSSRGVWWRCPKNEREATQNELKAQVRALILRHIPGAEISISDPGIVEGGRDYPIQIAVMGDDLEQVAVTANHFADVLRRTPGAIDVDVQHSPGAPELDVRVDRDLASQLHIPLALVASTVRASIEGEVAGLYHDDDDDIDIRVRLREADRANARQVGGLRIPTTGASFPSRTSPPSSAARGRLRSSASTADASSWSRGRRRDAPWATWSPSSRPSSAPRPCPSAWTT
jgi:cobalt-zinc-cadmium resistance protein CzcA